MSNTKICKQCRVEKEINLFSFNKSKNIYFGRCKSCSNKNASERRKNNPKRKAYEKEWYARKSSEQLRAENLKAKYGLTMEDYHRMFEAQDGTCAICRQQQSMRSKNGQHNLVVDHCHETGKIRGLLCSKCNTAIGLLNDCVVNLRFAQKYLLKDDRDDCA